MVRAEVAARDPRTASGAAAAPAASLQYIAMRTLGGSAILHALRHPYALAALRFGAAKCCSGAGSGPPSAISAFCACRLRCGRCCAAGEHGVAVWEQGVAAREQGVAVWEQGVAAGGQNVAVWEQGERARL